MGLFGKKKEQKESACCCGCAAGSAVQKEENSGADVKILGSGCAKCNALEKSVVEALAELGMNTAVDHVTDIAQIAAYGVMTTPALVVDEKVVCYGRVLKKEEAKEMIQKARCGK